MKLTPRYSTEPLVRLDPMIDGLAATVMKQRDRLAATLADLDAEQWATQSRCEGWTVQDVIIHLSSTNQFWAFSVKQGLAGEPTQFLLGFDPVASPAELVAGQRARRPARRSLSSSKATKRSPMPSPRLTAAAHGRCSPRLRRVTSRSASLRSTTLWDSWVHERDILIPLGLDPVVDDAEMEACLAYAAALGPTFHASTGSTRSGVIALDVTDPDVHVVIEVGSDIAIHRGSAPPTP